MAVLAQLLDDVVVHKFDLSSPLTTLGRRPDCSIVIEDSAVSGCHAQITLEANAFFREYLEAYVEDLNSTNGTRLNGRPLVGRQRLRHNDVLQVALNTFKFLDDNEDEMEKTVHLLRTQSAQQ